MKIALFWAIIILVGILTYILLNKISIIKTTFDLDISSPWFDLSLIIPLGYTVVLRCISFISKVF